MTQKFIPNFTQYPNEILDEWMPHLSGNQTKIMNVFVRQIYGFHKEYDKISIRQISQKTGIPIGGVFRDMKILIGLGCIRILKKGNKANPHTYEIVNITHVLSERVQEKKSKCVIAPITEVLSQREQGVIVERTQVLSQREQQNKEINIKINVKERELEPNIAHTSQLEPYSVEQLLQRSNNFLQQVGFGFTKDPRYILDQIYKMLPKDFRVKEDAKDPEIVKQALDKYSSCTASERDAISKKLFQGVESMAKLYLIKKYGEEFRDQLYPKILNDNLILYLGCNPTLKYCLNGFSNDIDGVYNEIARIIKKRIEKEQKEKDQEEQRRIERERVNRIVESQVTLTDDQIRAKGLRPISDILTTMNSKSIEDLIDVQYKPIEQTITEKERERLMELYKNRIQNLSLSLDEQSELVILERKLKGK